MGKAFEREEAVVEKPWGGFVPIALGDIAEVWSAYTHGDLSLYALRGYFAMREMHGWRAAVKCRSGSVREVRGSITKKEVIETLGGVRRGQARKILAELREANLVSVSKSGILLGEGQGRAVQVLEAIADGNGRDTKALVPIPRTILRRLATARSKAEVATVLGIAIRCLFLRKRDQQIRCVFGGACSAPWIASVFGVHVRRVREQRRRLIDIGWLREASNQAPWHERRYGRWFIADPEFGRPRLVKQREAKCTKVAGEGDRKCAVSAGAIRQSSSLREGSNSNPSEAVDSKSNRRFGNITRGDLSDTERTLKMHHRAVRLGLWGSCEADVASFVALAIHSVRHARVNAPGMFYRMLVDRKTGWLSEKDSDEAYRLIARLRHPEVAEPRSGRRDSRESASMLRTDFLSMSAVEQGQWKLEQRRKHLGFDQVA